MPHTDTIPVSASTASTGKGIRYISNWAYAYSGSSNPGSGPTTFLEFTSGSGLIVGKFELNADYAGTGGSNLQIEIYFNDIKIVLERDVGNDFVPGDNPYDVIIPPFTVVKVDISSTTAPANVNFIGRVYGAE